MTAFRVLFVCVGNVCRSPLGERLLAARLPEDQYAVGSAGVGAVEGEPMTPEAQAHLEARGGDAGGFRARQLVPEMVETADLVLTATKDLRSLVLEESPRAMRRTFTVREFATLLEVVDPLPDPRALVAEAAAQRSRAVLDDYDVPDPFRRGDAAHELAARLMADAVERIVKGLPR